MIIEGGCIGYVRIPDPPCKVCNGTGCALGEVPAPCPECWGQGVDVGWIFDHGCICDCPDNQDRHVIAECPNRLPLAPRIK